MIYFCFASRRRHTRCALVTGVQTCALPICTGPEQQPPPDRPVEACQHRIITQGRRQQGNEIAVLAVGHESWFSHWTGVVDRGYSVLNVHKPKQIGRASCREKVCRYVWISVVAVSLTKKTQSGQQKWR